MWVNGAQISGVKSLQWANNLQVEKHADDGEAFPTLVTIKQVRPVITIETTDLKTISALSAEGEAVTDFVAYLRRRRPSKLNYADNEAQHVKLSAGNGSLKWMRSGSDPAQATIEIHLHAPSGGTLFTVATAQAISSGATTTTTTTSTTTSTGGT